MKNEKYNGTARLVTNIIHEKYYQKFSQKYDMLDLMLCLIFMK